jgi:hypothetical protein
MLKAIETVYNGYRFRSRLEARWAVFFDELGVKYEYEKEGFDLDGVWYLPDFWLPGQKAWIEIKPKLDDHYLDLDDTKPKKLALLSEYPVYIYQGNPYPGEFLSRFLFTHNDGFTGKHIIHVSSETVMFKSSDFKPTSFFQFMHTFWSVNSLEDALNIFGEGDSREFIIDSCPRASELFDFLGCELPEYKYWMDKAFRIARQARF